MSLKSIPYQSSNTGTFYFAFGSNLSPAQMKARMRHDPKSSKPIATARLRDYSWYISERGYANIASLPPPTSSSTSTTAITSSSSTTTTTTTTTNPKQTITTTPPSTYIQGLLYNLTPEDEKALDKYEGYSPAKTGPPNPSTDPAEKQERPFLQGDCNYNKLYLVVEVVKWLNGFGPADFGLVPCDKHSSDGNRGDRGNNSDANNNNENVNDDDKKEYLRVLVYVDETRTKPGRIWDEYIARMSIGVTYAVTQCGMDRGWIQSVMGCYGIKLIEKIRFDEGDGKGYYTGVLEPGEDAEEWEREEWRFVEWIRGLVSRDLFE